MSASLRVVLPALIWLLGCSAISGLDDYRVDSVEGGAAGEGGEGGAGGALGSCLDGDVAVGLSCYGRGDQPRQWLGASALCQGVIGGQLAAMSTLAELSAVSQAQPALLAGATWLGGTDMPTEGSWRWTNGEDFVYALETPPWGTDEPNGDVDENCLEITAGGTLNDQACATELPYLCEYPRTAP